jgi:response regulator RpfG family c-di-GMP phosphodiesterase
VAASHRQGLTKGDEEKGMGCLLVIDDEQRIRQAIRAMLKPLRHSIIEAENGALGPALLAQNEVDLGSPT